MADEAIPPDSSHRRSPAMWIILFTTWIIGLVIWAGYLAMIAWLLYKILA